MLGTRDGGLRLVGQTSRMVYSSRRCTSPRTHGQVVCSADGRLPPGAVAARAFVLVAKRRALQRGRYGYCPLNALSGESVVSAAGTLLPALGRVTGDPRPSTSHPYPVPVRLVDGSTALRSRRAHRQPLRRAPSGRGFHLHGSLLGRRNKLESLRLGVRHGQLRVLERAALGHQLGNICSALLLLELQQPPLAALRALPTRPRRRFQLGASPAAVEVAAPTQNDENSQNGKEGRHPLDGA